MMNRLASAVVIALTLALPAAGTTFTVTNTNDSGTGSLRQAILDANAAGNSTVAFSIGTGLQTIQLLTPLPEIAETVFVNGSTQPGKSGTLPPIELDASSMAGSAAVLTVRGKVYSVAVNHFVGTGIEARGAATVLYCSVGLNGAGTAAAGAGAVGILVSNATAPGVTIGGSHTTVTGNEIGIEVTSGPATIQGVWIGTPWNANSALPGSATSRGIVITGVHNQAVTIGGGASGSYDSRANFVVGQRIAIEEISSDHVTYSGNYLGSGFTYTQANTEAGLHLVDSSDNTITQNDFKNSPTNVWVDGTSVRNLIHNNSMSNATKNISLTGNGNQLQPRPTVTAFTPDNLKTVVTGTLHAAPSQTYTIDVYYSYHSCGAADVEAIYRGQVSATTDAGGDATFQYVYGSVTLLSSISATATDASNNTSEFSPCTTVTTTEGFAFSLPTLSYPDFQEAGFTVLESAGVATLTVMRMYPTATTVAVSYATSDGSAKAGHDYAATSGTLTFAPGDTIKSISIPIINDQVSEGTRSFNLTMSNPTGGSKIYGQRTWSIVIHEDDPVPFALVAEPSYLTLASGSKADVNFTMTPPPLSPIALSVAASDATSLNLPVTVEIDASGHGTMTAAGLAVGSGSYAVMVPDANGGFSVNFGYQVTPEAPRRRAVHH